MSADPALRLCFDQAWDSLEIGAGPGRSAFSMVQLATIGLDGGPKLRTIVLRAASRDRRTLAFHTDRRSPKFAEIAADHRVSIVDYDREGGRQVRVEGLATLHVDDETADAAWAGSRDHSRVCYRSAFGPGDVLADPGLADPTEAALNPLSQDVGRGAFARVEIEVMRVDWLDLDVSGHRRAVFDWRPGGWAGKWVAP